MRLAGYASRQAPVSAVLDTIEIAALLLEGNGRRCLILGFDLMIVGAELAGLIQSRLGQIGFRPDEVMMLASHTHCAPATDSGLRAPRHARRQIHQRRGRGGGNAGAADAGRAAA